MPVKVTVNGAIESFHVISRNGACLFLTHSSGAEIKLVTPLKLDSTYKSKEFEVYFLAKRGIKENDIYQVFRRNTDVRIGWIVPVISLDSDLHDYKDNDHFLRYAYVGIRESLERIDDKIYSKILPGDIYECSLADIFHEETVLLILSKETYGDDFCFDINRSTPSLIKNGYIRLTERNPHEIKHKATVRSTKKLYIEEMTDSLENHALIADLMNNSFAYEEKAIFRFFYLYQIFELLIDNIYRNEQETLVDELIGAKGNSGQTKDLLEKIQQFMSEKRRLGLLITDYTSCNSKLKDLSYLCNNLLEKLGREKSDGFEGYFYKLRNFIFHQYRDFPAESTEILDEIVLEVISLLPSILATYSSPKRL